MAGNGDSSLLHNFELPIRRFEETPAGIPLPVLHVGVVLKAAADTDRKILRGRNQVDVVQFLTRRGPRCGDPIHSSSSHIPWL